MTNASSHINNATTKLSQLWHTLQSASDSLPPEHKRILASSFDSLIALEREVYRVATEIQAIESKEGAK